MFQKSIFKASKRMIHNFEDEPPDKKLISDGDLLIKRLSEKQLSTKINLQEQLMSKNNFEKTTEFVPLTNYSSGVSSLDNFHLISEKFEEIEKLKSLGLTNSDINLYGESKKGYNYLLNKHKNIDESALNCKLESINKLLNNEKNVQKSNETNRHKTEFALSTKPNSIETKLFEFYNKKNNQIQLPHPMDEIKEIEKKVIESTEIVNIKKIRKKARSLANQINSINEMFIDPIKLSLKQFDDNKNSKWNKKEIEELIPKTIKIINKNKKVYDCKPNNYYTIKNGEIIKIANPSTPSTSTNQKNRLSIDEIKSIGRFQNYDPGKPTDTLYLKNLANEVTEKDLEIIDEFPKDNVESLKVMKGRMRGQAFIKFINQECAGEALAKINGVIIKNKPIIAYFAKDKNS